MFELPKTEADADNSHLMLWQKSNPNSNFNTNVLPSYIHTGAQTLVNSNTNSVRDIRANKDELSLSMLNNDPILLNQHQTLSSAQNSTINLMQLAQTNGLNYTNQTYQSY